MEKSDVHRGFKLTWQDPPLTGRWVVNVSSNDHRLQMKIGSSAAVFTGATLDEAIASAKQFIDGLLDN